MPSELINWFPDIPRFLLRRRKLGVLRLEFNVSLENRSKKLTFVFFLTFHAWLASGAKGLTHCFDRLLPWTFQEVGFLEILYFPGLQIVLGQNVKTYGFPFGMNISDYQLLKKATSHLPASGDLTTSHMPIATFNVVKWLNWIQLFWWTNHEVLMMSVALSPESDGFMGLDVANIYYPAW